jgi:hypothetical protein
VFPELSAESCRAQLEPYKAALLDAMEAGVKRFNAIQPAETLYILSKRRRSRRTAIWACIMHEIETTMAGMEGLRLVPKYETIELYFGENMVARIKAMNPQGFTSNYMTPRVRAFHTERRRKGRTYASPDQGELFTVLWAVPVRVDIGYVDDELQIAIAKVMVARRRTPKELAWVFELTNAPLVVPLPAPTFDTAIVAKNPSASDAEAPPTKSTRPRIVARQKDSNQHEAQGTDE